LDAANGRPVQLDEGKQNLCCVVSTKTLRVLALQSADRSCGFPPIGLTAKRARDNAKDLLIKLIVEIRGHRPLALRIVFALT
jgi:hypothetical protein